MNKKDKIMASIYFDYYKILYVIVPIIYLVGYILELLWQASNGLDPIFQMIDTIKLVVGTYVLLYLAIIFRRYLLKFTNDYNALYIRGIIQSLEGLMVVFVTNSIVQRFNNGFGELIRYMHCLIVVICIHIMAYLFCRIIKYRKKQLSLLNSNLIVQSLILYLVNSIYIYKQTRIALILIVVIILNVIYYYKIIIKKEDKINYRIANINILKHLIFCKEEIEDGNVNLIKIGLGAYFPQNSTDLRVKIRGYNSYLSEITTELENKSIILAVPNKQSGIEEHHLTIEYSYNLKVEKEKIKKFRNKLFIRIQVMSNSGISYPLGATIYKNIRCIFRNKIINPDYIYLEDKDLAKLAVDLLYVDDEFESEDYLDKYNAIKVPNSKEVNFMYQDGTYGEGKSTRAFLTLIKNGYIPVVISPWEENTSNNLIYSMVLKMKEINQDILFNELAKKTCIVFISTYIVTLKLVKELFNITLLYDLNSIIAIILGGFVMYNLLYKSFVINLLVYKDQLNIYYKDALIKDLISYINRSDRKLVMVIEDIDRMDMNQIKEIFKDISFINRQFNNLCMKKRLLGIVSFDKRKLEDRYNKEGIEEYKEVHNKIFYNEFNEGYIEFDMIMKYKDETAKYLSLIYSASYISEEFEKIITKGNITSFREIKKTCNQIIITGELLR